MRAIRTVRAFTLCAAWQPDARARRVCEHVLAHDGSWKQLATRDAAGRVASYMAALAAGNELTAAMLLERARVEQAKAQQLLLGDDDSASATGKHRRAKAKK